MSGSGGVKEVLAGLVVAAGLAGAMVLLPQAATDPTAGTGPVSDTVTVDDWVVTMNSTERRTGPDGGLLYDHLVIKEAPASAAYDSDLVITPDEPLSHAEATTYIQRMVAAHRK